MYRRGGNSICVLHNNIRKIHTTFPDGTELVEEYNNETHQLLMRKRRSTLTTGAVGNWEVLLGDVQPAARAAQSAGGMLMQESSKNPVCTRTDDPGYFTWHINNLPYDASVYSVTADPSSSTIVVATSNKKYYKRLALPELHLLKLVLDPNCLSWFHQGDTLTVQYSKPPALLAEELADSKSAMALRPQEDPGECRQQ